MKNASRGGRGRKPSANSPHLHRAIDFAAKAVSMRRAGMTFDAIARELDVSQSVVWMAVDRWMKRTREEVKEAANDVREMELARLDKATELIMSAIEDGELQAVDRLVKVIDRRSKLLGLDAPTQIQATLDGVDGASYAERLARMTPEELADERRRITGKG